MFVEQWKTDKNVSLKFSPFRLSNQTCSLPNALKQKNSKHCQPWNEEYWVKPINGVYWARTNMRAKRAEHYLLIPFELKLTCIFQSLSHFLDFTVGNILWGTFSFHIFLCSVNCGCSYWKKFKFNVRPLSFSVKGTETCTASFINLSRPNVKLKINALMERRGLNDSEQRGKMEWIVVYFIDVKTWNFPVPTFRGLLWVTGLGCTGNWIFLPKIYFMFYSRFSVVILCF